MDDKDLPQKAKKRFDNVIDITSRIKKPKLVYQEIVDTMSTYTDTSEKWGVYLMGSGKEMSLYPIFPDGFSFQDEWGAYCLTFNEEEGRDDMHFYPCNYPLAPSADAFKPDNLN